MDTLFPISLSSIAGSLRRAGYDIDCFDTTFYPDQVDDQQESSDDKKAENLQVLSVNYDDVGIKPKLTNVFEDFKEKVKSYQPDLIGVSAVEPTFMLAINLLESIKEFDIPNIVGGVHAIFSPDHVMGYDVVDMVCIGEGEESIIDLCSKLENNEDYSDVGNIWVRNDGVIYKNKKTKLQQLDNLPFLDFSIFEPERIFRPMSGKLYRMIPIEFSRGCIYKCTYCSAPSFNHNFQEQGVWLRNKSLDLIFEEINYYIENYDAEYFYFVSETFLAIPKKRLTEFIERYAEIKIPFWFNTRAETLNPEVIKQLEDIGCHRMSIGVECGNEEYRKTMLSRPVSNKKTIEACLYFVDSKIELSVNNIIGYPDETRELIFDTIELNRAITDATESHSCSIFQPYRGTKLHDYCVEKGYWPGDKLASDLNFDPCISYPNLTHDEIRGIHRTFPFYIKFPRSEWNLIEQAEKLDEKGDAVFDTLKNMYQDRFLSP